MQPPNRNKASPPQPRGVKYDSQGITSPRVSPWVAPRQTIFFPPSGEGWGEDPSLDKDTARLLSSARRVVRTSGAIHHERIGASQRTSSFESCSAFTTAGTGWREQCFQVHHERRISFHISNLASLRPFVRAGTTTSGRALRTLSVRDYFCDPQICVFE